MKKSILTLKVLKTFLGSLFVTSLLLTTACSSNDDIDNGPITTPPTAEEFNTLINNVREDLIQEFQFNAEDGYVTFTSEKGVSININGNCLTQNGDPVTGTVDLAYAELFDKSTMLTTKLPTMGIMDNGDRVMLVSGGEFYLEVTQNGEELNTNCGFYLQIPVALTGGAENDMTLWTGTFDEDGNLEWDENDDATGQGENGVFVEGEQYYAFVQNFGWTNVDKFYNDPRPKTTIYAQVPDGYDNENSAVYLSYDGEDSGLALLDTYNDGLFSEHYGQIPIGLECHAIFVSEEDGNWRYAIKAVTIADNDIITFNYEETTVATESELIAAIDALP